MFSADTDRFRSGLMVTALAAVIVVATGCKDYSFVRDRTLPPPLQEDEQFLADLASEYQVLGDFIESQPQGQLLPVRFYDKARAARGGTSVTPDTLAEYHIPAFAVHDLMKARQFLVEALDTVNVPENARMLAMAQVKFDCWLAFQPYQKSAQSYIGCREAFRQAMANVDFTKKSISLSSPAVAASGSRTIRFRDETITLDPQAQSVIEQVAIMALAKEGAIVVLTGHSKSKASIEDTSNNAVRRIIAVRNALYQNGVDPDAVEPRFEPGGSALDVDIEVRYGGASS
ncbi:MAG: hypothetical protein HYS17_10390 [Micavibrio aeruginosavorus]|uniref:OmpA-like domain-containing protein n=1 Tax=Micavibrio aeruginosavorus TaxID=349221 RepID=A0A7T5R1R1_9BACT|nr:MAG: hypothetical protein HYS17_10390 [Micavibrio aeruginosavorus]